jgi:CMP-N,N'-diacetyllegionaminic acid synthase
MKNKKFIAIIPARSGSKGFIDKNTMSLNGTPLFTHSIRFANKLSFIDDVLFLTDSEDYAKIAKIHGASVPYIRSKNSSSDTAMEEDILIELSSKISFDDNTHILWLRPTHPLRDLEKFEDAYSMFNNEILDSVCLVTPVDSRVYKDDKGFLKPFDNSLKSKSMWRRQEVTKGFKIYHGELFRMPNEYNPNFLGNKVGYVEMSSLCSFDIDDSNDLDYLNNRIKTGMYDEFIH